MQMETTVQPAVTLTPVSHGGESDGGCDGRGVAGPASAEPLMPPTPSPSWTSRPPGVGRVPILLNPLESMKPSPPSVPSGTPALPPSEPGMQMTRLAPTILRVSGDQRSPTVEIPGTRCGSSEQGQRTIHGTRRLELVPRPVVEMAGAGGPQAAPPMRAVRTQ